MNTVFRLKKAGKRRKQTAKREDDIPDHLKDFINSISIKPLEDEDNTKGSVKKKISQTKSEEDKPKQPYVFTEMEVVNLWNTFKLDFPEDSINKLQMTELVKRIFPRCNAELVIGNLFKVFDPDNSGSVVPTELLVAFSMSMKGSVEDKLRWTFKLYDKDGSGEIDPDEMEDIFRKLCKIAAGIESDQNRLLAKEKEKEEKLREKEAEAKDKEMLSGVKKPNIYSRRMSRIVEAKMSGQNNSKKSLANVIKSRRSSLADISDKSDTLTEEEQEKKKVMETIIAELKDPNRDYNNFDPGKRARELFEALDDDGNGSLTEEEFVEGCMTDDAFINLLRDFNGDFIWG